MGDRIMAQFHYKELGLVNTREMFHKAMAGHYAVPAYNFNNLEQLEAIVIGCIQSKISCYSPVFGQRPQKHAERPWCPIWSRGPWK